MILYFSRSGKTQAFAQALHDILGLPLYRLESELGGLKKLRFFVTVVSRMMSRKPTPVTNMPPEPLPAEIWLCGPVWAGDAALPLQHFLQQATLRGVTVNLLLTAAQPDEKYRKQGHKLLAATACTPGEVLLFATRGEPDMPTITEQLRDMLPPQ